MNMADTPAGEAIEISVSYLREHLSDILAEVLLNKRVYVIRKGKRRVAYLHPPTAEDLSQPRKAKKSREEKSRLVIDDLPPAFMDKLGKLVKTGLYGRSLSEAGRRLMEEGIKRILIIERMKSKQPSRFDER